MRERFSLISSSHSPAPLRTHTATQSLKAPITEGAYLGEMQGLRLEGRDAFRDEMNRERKALARTKRRKRGSHPALPAALSRRRANRETLFARSPRSLYPAPCATGTRSPPPLTSWPSSGCLFPLAGPAARSPAHGGVPRSGWARRPADRDGRPGLPLASRVCVIPAQVFFPSHVLVS